MSATLRTADITSVPETVKYHSRSIFGGLNHTSTIKITTTTFIIYVHDYSLTNQGKCQKFHFKLVIERYSNCFIHICAPPLKFSQKCEQMMLSIFVIEFPQNGILQLPGWRKYLLVKECNSLIFLNYANHTFFHSLADPATCK